MNKARRRETSGFLFGGADCYNTHMSENKLTQKQVYERLKKVIDPELGMNIVDLGLVYKVAVLRRPGGTNTAKLRIVMTLTTPGCPLAGMFDQMVREALEGLPGIDALKDVKIELTFDPPWTQEMMSEGARAELGID